MASSSEDQSSTTFEMSLSLWDIAPDEMVGLGADEVNVTRAELVGERGDEELELTFEVVL